MRLFFPHYGRSALLNQSDPGSLKGQTLRSDVRTMQSAAPSFLIFLRIFLRSLHSTQTYFTFEDTLTQIGLGYVFLFLLGFTRVRTQVVTLVLILVFFWAALGLCPAPASGPQFDYARVRSCAELTASPLYRGFFRALERELRGIMTP